MIDDGGYGVRRLANAWSLGDIEQLRKLVPLYAAVDESHQPGKCKAALYGEKTANDYTARRTESWLRAAERALRENASTMAVVPIVELFAPDGYVARLRALGYEVVEPQRGVHSQ
jgi:hypothetical protein